MADRLIVAAHPDDAVLSCFDGLGADVLVAVVFAGVPPKDVPPSSWDQSAGAAAMSGADAMARRRDEDRTAISRAGAELVHLDFIDCGYGMSTDPPELIAAALIPLLEEVGEVWLPVAVGDHADHVTVREAGLLAAAGRRVVWYADQPYTAALLAEYDLDSGRASVGQLQAAMVAASPRVPGAVSPELIRLDDAALVDKQTAIECYDSQQAALEAAFGDVVRSGALRYELRWPAGLVPVVEAPGAVLLARLQQRPIVKSANAQRLFASVVVRTEGEREAGLSDALSSLAAQTSTDFEVIVVGHDLDQPRREAVFAMLEAIPQHLRERLTFTESVGGSRARPLNHAIAIAQGAYLSVLDDDDVATPEWIDTFRRLHERSPGAVLRARVGRLRRKDDRWEQDMPFPAGFDLLEHLLGNQSPVCGLALPLDEMRALRLEFDETLPVFEDWDLLLQLAPLAGVACDPSVTSWYRSWGADDDSHSRHDPHEWTVAARIIRDKLARSPLVIPPDTIYELAALLEQRADLARQVEEHAKRVDEVQGAHESELAVVARESQRIIDDLNARLAASRQEVADTITRFHTTASWRITAPFRAVTGLRHRRSRVTEEQDRPAATDVSTASPTLPVPPPNRTWPTEIFEALYAADADPWNFADSWYEHRKYALTVAALPRSRYRRAFEPGCSIGVLTSLLAQRCDSVLAADAVAGAVDQARERFSAHAHVELRQLVIPEQWPHEQFDLIVLSEIATYLDADDLELVAKLSTEALEPGGHLVLVHFLADGGTPSTAREVHRRFQDDPALVSVVEHRDRAFLLDVHARV